MPKRTPTPPSRSPRWFRPVFVVLIIVVAAAATLVLRQQGRSPAGNAAPSPSPRSVAASLDLQATHDRAVDLFTRGRWYESLPYFRRQLELLDPTPWQARVDFASALWNAAVQVDAQGPVVRSSFERVAMIREGFDQIALAEASGGTAGRATATSSRAQTLSWWGLPWDALSELERARALADPPAGVEQRYRTLYRILERPMDMSR